MISKLLGTEILVAEVPIAQGNRSWGVSFLLARNHREARGKSRLRMHTSRTVRKGSFVRYKWLARELPSWYVTSCTHINSFSVRREVTKVEKHWIQ